MLIVVPNLPIWTGYLVYTGVCRAIKKALKIGKFKAFCPLCVRVVCCQLASKSLMPNKASSSGRIAASLVEWHLVRVAQLVSDSSPGGCRLPSIRVCGQCSGALILSLDTALFAA